MNKPTPPTAEGAEATTSSRPDAACTSTLPADQARDSAATSSAGTELPFAQYLRIERLRAGKSQRALARAIGQHYSYVSRLESGEIANPSPEVIQRIAEALGIDLADILAFWGFDVRQRLPRIEEYLREEYGFDDDAIADAQGYLAQLAERQAARKQQGPQPTLKRNRGGD